MTIEKHLKRAVAELVSALDLPDELAPMHRNALNLAVSHAMGVQAALAGDRPKAPPGAARVAGDPEI